ncbi:MAG TPA: hypothetical protein DCM64_10970, partial [Gammaproteobacteria bacterium]|nr:hypothetical protein [Gammaproteobacteria bacterium]
MDARLPSSNHSVAIASEAAPDLSEVGGKGASLIRLSQAGFNVPPGFVLKVDFFSEWNHTLAESDLWQQMLQTSPDDLEAITRRCDALKDYAASLRFSEQQLDLIKQSAEQGNSYAVRSSSPEEDLADSSFAGLHELL